MSIGLIKDGDAMFSLGMDSVSDPLTLRGGTYIFASNMINRGGAIQTRPGYRYCFTLPDGIPQGLATYRPRRGKPSLIGFVDGVPHISQEPFRSVKVVAGARLSKGAKRVYTAPSVQSVERNPDASLKLISPRNLLMAQDGVNPPAYFDGRVFTAQTGARVTPQGTHMAWAGGRLWVARREQLFASDIANPLSFYEQEFNTLGGINYFLLPGQCSGLAALPGMGSSVKASLMAFTDTTTSMFRSEILSRDLWTQTDDFQTCPFPYIGNVSARSITAASGMLWWFSNFGQVRLDSARASAISSRIDFIDREMSRSSANFGSDLSGIASTTYENFVLTSVPSANKRNAHTWVFDSSVNDLLTNTFGPVWSGLWTGVNPVEWVKMEVAGSTRIFCLSADDDGHNRVYEAFTEERRDNGCDIPWAFETRAYTAGTLTPKHFRYLEYALSEMQGQVDFRVSWSGASRGRWKSIATPTFFAREGNIDATDILTANTPLYALKKQSRNHRTSDVRDLPEDPLTSSGVEGPVYAVEADKETIDTAFVFRVEGSGPVAFRAMRVFMDEVKEPDSGTEDNPELDEHFVRFDGAASKDESNLDEPPESFTATKTAAAQWNNFASEASATITSSVSQSDADKRASQVAHARAESLLRAKATPYVGGRLV